MGVLEVLRSRSKNIDCVASHCSARGAICGFLLVSRHERVTGPGAQRKLTGQGALVSTI